MAHQVHQGNIHLENFTVNLGLGEVLIYKSLPLKLATANIGTINFLHKCSKLAGYNFFATDYTDYHRCF